MKRFEDYKQGVILAYKKKKDEGSLPPNLQHHTSANIKKEILNVFSERHSEKDDVTFSFFFNKQGNAGEHFKMIEDATPDVFKPLNIFLRKDTHRGTHDRNIYLLAWLIDFTPRPYRAADIYELVKQDRESLTPQIQPSTKESPDIKIEFADDTASEIDNINEEDIRDKESLIEETPDENTNPDAEEIPPAPADDLSIINQNFGVPRKFNRAIVAFFAAFVILSGTYIFYNAGDHQCMYWNVDHYTAIPCDQKVDGATIIALDTFRLVRLKKITNLKLITPNGIGKIHYSKLYGKVEFYTTGGENPTDNRKRLLPMTEFIYRKYVLKID